MAALPTICLSAIRALIPGGSWDATGAPSSASSSAQPSGAPSSYNSLPVTSCRNVDKNLYYKEADEKSREVDHAERDYEFAGLQRFGRASLVAIAAASLCYSSPDPALAFRGGGPYGQEVTRGQDLTGRDYSGLTLIKQDFKTSILRQANFKGAKLLGASFFDSDLTGADLTDADLRGADLSLARLSKSKSCDRQCN
uniref:Uncharacterized protein n=1 Tax=Physcomitrium patens TaxID=3218 RepID=A0A7I4EZW8_PHYPA